jgi:hypothetical protein
MGSIAQAEFVKKLISNFKKTINEEFLLRANVQDISLRIERLLFLYKTYDDLNMELMDSEGESFVDDIYFDTMELLRTKMAQLSGKGSDMYNLISPKTNNNINEPGYIFLQSLMPLDSCLEVDVGATTVPTKLYDLIAGSIRESAQQETLDFFRQKQEDDNNLHVSRVWQRESVPEVFVEDKSEHEGAEVFQNNTLLKVNQIQIKKALKMPFQEINEFLVESLTKRLNYFEKIYERSINFVDKYKNCIHNCIHLKHIKYVYISNYDHGKYTQYFIHQHPFIVKKTNSTKLRMVFGSFIKTFNKVSLDDLMIKYGLIVKKQLSFIVLLFRIIK